MHRTTPAIPGLVALAFILACGGQPVDRSTDSHEETVESNVLLAEWAGPYGGVPAFDRMELDALKPALEFGMANHLEELDTIAAHPEPATFDNTIAAMERSGRALDRAIVYCGIWSSNVSTPEFRAIQTEMAPRLAEYRSKITQNATLFERISSVYEGGEMKSLRPDQ